MGLRCLDGPAVLIDEELILGFLVGTDLSDDTNPTSRAGDVQGSPEPRSGGAKEESRRVVRAKTTDQLSGFGRAW